MAITDLLLPEFDHEMENTRKMLAAVPGDRLDFKPHPKSFNLKDLATHIATLPGWAVSTVEQPEFDFAPDGKPYSPPVLNSTQELLETFDQGVAKARAALAGVTDEALQQPWSLLQTGKVLFTMPRIAVIRSFVLNHTIHHRAQLSVYLRLLDQKVPGMYGPSADEMS